MPPIEQENTVLKKTGIVVAAAATGLLAVSSLAFASDDDQHGRINIHDITRRAPVQTCGETSDSGRTYSGYGSKVENKQVNSGHCEQSISSDN
jgi:hypothetical protein